MRLFAKFEKELPRVDGKVFAITGTTSGTGFVAARTVAQHGGEVLLLNRPSERATASLAKLEAAVPGGTFTQIDCDLMDFASVRAAATAVAARLGDDGALYCLANNAGIMAVDNKVTKDSYDVQMQTNHLSHFLLTRELFPLLLKGSAKHGDARIVSHSSIARLMTEHQKLEEKYFLQHEDGDGELGGNEEEGLMKGGPWFRYQQTKLANSVFNHALHDKLRASSDEGCKNVLAICCHPGVSKTNLGDHLNAKANFFQKYIMGPLFNTFFSQSSEDGTMGLLKGMMDSKENLESGSLYGPELLMPKKEGQPPAFLKEMKISGPAVKNPVMKFETDQESKDMLWKASEDATGAKFDM